MAEEILANEQYILSGTKRLRCGFTTGTCAALASRAAVEALLLGSVPETVSLRTPKGWLVKTAVIADETPVSFSNGGKRFRCGVQKDAGDDPDVTDGCQIFATAELVPAERLSAGGAVATASDNADASDVRVMIDGGKGVGRVTKAGLDQKIGEAAINHVPRQMITAAVQDVCESYGFSGTVRITIDIPQGEALARQTFNPQLGIEDGISVIGTSGVVEPMSEQALTDALETEIRVIAASYEDKTDRPLVITPGNYGKDFVALHPEWKNLPVLRCANFIGNAIDLAAAYGFTHVIFVGHAGKFVKLAGGIMNTHSHVADARMELICAHAALCGADKDLCAKIMDCATVDAALSVLDASNLTETVTRSLISAARKHVERRINGAYSFDLIMFTNERGVIASA
ncbi:MAG: cobalamin biosynthesis protein CbiD [Treponema sp.]|nr:cobalamin biosynthesis protein CbiD [Treponema sp.]